MNIEASCREKVYKSLCLTFSGHYFPLSYIGRKLKFQLLSHFFFRNDQVSSNQICREVSVLLLLYFL